MISGPHWYLLQWLKSDRLRGQYELSIMDFTRVIECRLTESTSRMSSIPLNHAVRLRGESYFLNQELEKAIEVL